MLFYTVTYFGELFRGIETREGDRPEQHYGKPLFNKKKKMYSLYCILFLMNTKKTFL